MLDTVASRRGRGLMPLCCPVGSFPGRHVRRKGSGSGGRIALLSEVLSAPCTTKGGRGSEPMDHPDLRASQESALVVSANNFELLRQVKWREKIGGCPNPIIAVTSP